MSNISATCLNPLPVQSIRANDGIGIGLTLAKKIVERHDGNILIDSEFGKGTTVRFRLPSSRLTFFLRKLYELIFAI